MEILKNIFFVTIMEKKEIKELINSKYKIITLNERLIKLRVICFDILLQNNGFWQVETYLDYKKY